MLPAPVAVPTADSLPAEDLLRTVLRISLTAINLLRPVYAADGTEIVDFVPGYLNPAGQRMSGLPELPGGTMRDNYPDAEPQGIFAFYRDTYLAGEVRTYETNYQADGLDNYFRFTAQRQGDVLVVSFSDTADQPRTAAEQALRAAQAAEHAARTEAETEREHLRRVLLEAPAVIATYRGPEHVYDLVNLASERLMGGRPMGGRPIREALPELAGQQYFELLDRVYATGEPFFGREMESWVDFTGTGRLELGYFNVYFQATRDAQGGVDGLLSFAYDVTEQVQARQQLDNLNEELAAANEELQATNEEYHVSNAALAEAQRLLRQLNQELEAHVADRTREARAARAAAERQRARLERLFMRAPAAICILSGPALVYELVNPGYQAMFPGRELLGQPLLEALPELAGQPIMAIIERVSATGEPFEASEQLVRLARTTGGPIEDLYFDLTYQARFDEAGRVDGFITYAYDITERVRTRQRTEALQAELLAAARSQAQEREVYYQIFEQTPALICILRGPEHCYEYFNSAYQRQFAGRELLDRSVAGALPETVEQGFIALLDGVYESGETFFGYELPLALAGPDGTLPAPAYYDVTYQALREDGRVVGISVFAFDVSERVLARRQTETLQAELLAAAKNSAQEREAFYQIFEQAPAGVALLREPAHRFEYVNPAYQAFFPGRQVRGRTFAEVMPEGVGQGFLALLDGVFQTGATHYGSETRADVGQPDGSVRTGYYNFTYQAHREDGEIAGISVFAFDVTEQVLSRRQREAQRQLLSQVFAQAPVAICVFRGPDYVLDVVNPPMADLLGQPLPVLLGQPFFKVVPELQSQGLRELLDEVGRTGQPFVAQERPMQLAHHGPGEARYFNFVYQPLRDEHGQLTAIVCVAIEVSEQVAARRKVENLNQELAAINEELQATNEELGDTNHALTRTNADLDNFIYTASHDLRAPISNLEGLLHALQEQLPAAARQTEQVQPLLGMMQGAIERFQLTISQLTDLTRLQQAHAQAAETVNLAALIEAVRLDLAPALAAAGAQLSVDVVACPNVQFAPKNLRSIVYNLLSNAVKYRQPDRPALVQLRAHCPPGFTILEVQDNGLGLSEAQQGRLFGMFERLHDHVEGTGIGLYMVKKIVENAGGTIRVLSAPGVGSTFTIALPG